MPSLARTDEAAGRELCTDLRGADFSEAYLQGANFDHAKLQGSRFGKAMMQGSSLTNANLTASIFTFARLEGASFSGAKALGVSFVLAQAQGADFSESDLSASSFVRMQLQGANFKSATISHAVFNEANLYRAFVDNNVLENAILLRLSADNRFPRLAFTDHDEADPAPEKLDSAGYNKLIERALDGATDKTRDSILKRLKSLDPNRQVDEGQLVWNRLIRWNKETNGIISKRRHAQLAKIMCDGANAPFYARGFIYNGKLANDEKERGRLIAKLSDIQKCPGARGLDASDDAEIERIKAELHQFRKHYNAHKN